MRPGLPLKGTFRRLLPVVWCSDKTRKKKTRHFVRFFMARADPNVPTSKEKPIILCSFSLLEQVPCSYLPTSEMQSCRTAEFHGSAQMHPPRECMSFLSLCFCRDIALHQNAKIGRFTLYFVLKENSMIMILSSSSSSSSSL